MKRAKAKEPSETESRPAKKRKKAAEPKSAPAKQSSTSDLDSGECTCPQKVDTNAHAYGKLEGEGTRIRDSG